MACVSMDASMGKLNTRYYKEMCVIHYCVNYRFSRRIMWLRITPTNHDPQVILRFFLEGVEEINGIM